MATQAHTAPNDGDNRSLHGNSDSTTLASSTPTNMRCPDPSVHQAKDTSLQDHASAAALYSPTKVSTRRDGNPLGPDGKLSSASAATSLRHAKVHDLPSFPVVGIDTRSSAGAAASLANTNTKSPEWWKPEHSTAAGKAALLANDYKMTPLWQPEASAAGSKAALLAHKGGPNLNLWTPEASAQGHTAATLAMKNQRVPYKVDYGHTDDGRSRALVAATGAVSSAGRKRAQSTPPQPPLYPDSKNSARNALSAATLAHTPSMTAKTAVSDSNRLGSGAMEAARIQHSKSVSRDMYTARPPVSLEVEEKKHQDALRASAISMAKKIYDVQQEQIDRAAHSSKSNAHSGATVAHGQQGHSSEADIKQQAMQYIGIQEAAQKLAAERLAKIGPDENAAFRSYYGYEKPGRTKLSLRRGRNRAYSNPEKADPDDSDEDDLRSRRIRTQMSQFNQKVAEVDAKKREQDRKYLLAAAERKVHAQMQGMDKKIFDETGKMSPAMVEEWDAKARAKAAADSEARMENHGRVHIGSGKYMDQADIDAVAQARIQPTLDEITDKTEKRRAAEEERRLELELKKYEERREKERAAELKAEEKRIKDEEKRAAKSRTTEEKAAAKQEKEAEKEKQAEEKRIQDDETRKSREASTAVDAVDVTSPVAGAPATTEDENNDLYRDPTPAARPAHFIEPESSSTTSPASPTSPTSPKSDSKGIKSFLNKFKRRSKHSASSAETDKPGFIGGVALRESSSPSNRDSVPASSHQEHDRSNERRYSDVSSIEADRGRTAKRTASGLSEVSSASDYEEARDDFDEQLAPPPTFTSNEVSAARKGSPNRDSKFTEVGI